MSEQVITELFRSLGPSYFTGPLNFGQALEQTGQVLFFNSSSALATGFQAGNTSAAVTYTLPTAGPSVSGSVLASTTTGVLSWFDSVAAFAPIGAAFVTIGNTSALTAERALTGTSNQIIVSDNGANSTVVLSLPQNIHTAATPTFASLTLSATTNQIVLGTTNTTTITSPAPAASRVYTIPDAGAAASFLMTAGDQSASGSLTLTKATGNTLVVDTTTLVVDASNNNVGIGTASPGSYNSNARDLVVRNASSNVGVTLSSTANGTCFIGFTDSEGTTLNGLIQYDHNATPGNEVIKFRVNSVDDLLTVTAGGSVVCNSGAIATNATVGFLYIPTCAGTPSGTPATFTGRVPMVYDSTNNKLYIYDGSWLGGTTPGAWV